MEKMSIVLNYWKSFFSKNAKDENIFRGEDSRSSLQRSFNASPRDGSTDLVPHSSNSLGDNPGVGQKTSLSDSRKNKKISLLHSSKEKLRRERIKDCCEQLRTLLPYIKGRKNDAASILEATVDYVKCIRERIPPAIMVQITKMLQSNRRFCKKQHVANQPFLSSTVKTQRERNVVTNRQSPVKEIRFLGNKCLNVYSLPASECPLDEALKVSRFPSHYYSSALGQTCSQHHKCLHQSWAC